MSFKVILSRAAVADIEEAMLWYEKQRQGLGYDFELIIEEGLKFIEGNPNLSTYKYKSIRVKYIKRFPYGLH